MPRPFFDDELLTANCLLDFLFLRFVRGDPQRAEKAFVVRADLELPLLLLRRQRFQRRLSATPAPPPPRPLAVPLHALSHAFHLHPPSPPAPSDALPTAIRCRP